MQSQAMGSGEFKSLEGKHFDSKVKSVIFLFMDGGVSHVDSFDQIGRASCRERVSGLV